MIPKGLRGFSARNTERDVLTFWWHTVALNGIGWNIFLPTIAFLIAFFVHRILLPFRPQSFGDLGNAVVGFTLFMLV